MIQCMLVSFDIKFMRRDQKQRRNGEACQASPMCFSSSLINLISKDIYMVFYVHESCIISKFYGKNDSETNKKRMQFCLNLLTSRMRYDMNH